jgi:hypothetical protein
MKSGALKRLFFSPGMLIFQPHVRARTCIKREEW